VKLTIDGKAYSQPLTVAHDPRVTIPETAYQHQFELARKVEAEQAKLAIAKGEADKLHAALQKAGEGANGDLRQSIDALDAKVVAAAAIVHAPNPYNAWSFPPDNVQNFGYLEGAFRSLAQAVDGGADAAPSPDARNGYTKLSGLLDASLQKWDALKTTELPALNAKLEAAGKKPIGIELKEIKS
jgi:hypothetical protein